MNILKRSLRGVYRNPTRNAIMIILLAISLSLSLTMIEVNEAFESQIRQIRSDVGTDISLRPAGYVPASSLTMPMEPVEELANMSEIASIEYKLNLTWEEPSLTKSGIDDETQRLLAERGASQENIIGMIDNARVGIIGTTNPDILSYRGRIIGTQGFVVEAATPVTVIDGRTFTLDETDADVVVMGVGMAEANALSMGDFVDIMGYPLEIIGLHISEPGDMLSLNALFMPLKTAQRITGKSGQITEALIFADDAEYAESIVAAINEIIESPSLTTNIDAYNELAIPLQNAQKSSKIGMYACLAACIVVILFTMFLALRNRMKEIGILKTVGASNSSVILQFAAESITVSLIAAVIGCVATYLFADTVAGYIMSGQSFNGAETSQSFIIAVSNDILLYALSISLVLALLGSCVPAWGIARIKPAEVLRNE